MIGSGGGEDSEFLVDRRIIRSDHLFYDSTWLKPEMYQTHVVHMSDKMRYLFNKNVI